MTRTLDQVAAEAATCTKCRLAQGRTQVVFGVGDPDADLLFIGEGPGFHEDKQGEPFVGAAGQLLTRMLGEIGLTREQVYIANIVKCRPPGNRDPQADEIEACTPWLVEQIGLIQPKVVVTLGNFATKFVLNTQAGITRLRGQVHTWHGRTVIPTFHPAAILHGGGEKSRQFQLLSEDFQLVQRTLEGVPEVAEEGPDASAPRTTPADRPALRRARRGAAGAVLMEIQLRAGTAEDTRDVGEALAPLFQPRDVVVLTGELGAGKTTFVQGVAEGLGIKEPIVSPTFTLVKEYSGRLEVAHVDVYRLDRVQDVVDLGLDELGEGEDLLLVEWGDAVEELLSDERLRVELTTVDPTGEDEARRVLITASRGRVGDAVGTRGAGADPVERAVIVVGIETSTPQTSVAIGTEQEILASVSIAGRARQEAVTPALHQLLAWTDLELSPGGRDRGGRRAGSVHRVAGRRGDREDPGPGAGGPHRGHHEPGRAGLRPRHTQKRIAAVIDGRRGEVFYSIYRSVPGGVVRETEHAVASPPSAWRLSWRRVPGEVLAVGNGAMLYRHELEGSAAGSRSLRPSSAHPDAAALVELAVPRFLREEHDRLYDVVPVYLRKSDAEIAWDKRARGASA